MNDITINRESMRKLAKALTFINGADHPTTLALEAAAGCCGDGAAGADLASQRPTQASAGSAGTVKSQALLSRSSLAARSHPGLAKGRVLRG